MTLENKDIIEKQVIDFIQNMNEWERYCLELEEDESIPFDEEDAKQKQRLVEIFEKYCTDKDRKNGSPNTIAYGSEGSYIYDFEDEKIVNIEINKNKAIVYTVRTKPMEKKHRYGMLKKNNQWLLDSKKRYSFYKEKWEVISL